MLVAATELTGALASNGETGVFTSTINAGKQLLKGNPFEWSEGVALMTVAAGTAWYFGHRNGYNDAVSGKPYKHGGII